MGGVGLGAWAATPQKVEPTPQSTQETKKEQAAGNTQAPPDRNPSVVITGWRNMEKRLDDIGITSHDLATQCRCTPCTQVCHQMITQSTANGTRVTP
jgi:hypothetical protein